MTRKERYQNFVKHFSKTMPNPKTELDYTTPLELLIAVVLSAQCTDQRVNLVTPALFKRFSTLKTLASADIEEVFHYIKSISYPNSKAKYLVGLAQKLMSDFDAKIPEDTEALETLPGVGRKTANVVASVLFNKPVMPVDTHVFRVSERIGLTIGAKTPKAAEEQLVKHLPKAVIAKAHHWLILHGRYVCKARMPQCKSCDITLMCKHYSIIKLKH